MLDEFIAGWAFILRRWTSERDMSCSRRDLQHLIRQLDGWFDNRDVPGMMEAEPSKPTTAQPVKPMVNKKIPPTSMPSLPVCQVSNNPFESGGTVGNLLA